MARGLFAQQNTIKTAFRFSRINFYFVTAFYSLYDICMAKPRTHKRKKQRKTQDYIKQQYNTHMMCNSLV